jgi:heat shock protein HslJ
MKKLILALLITSIISCSPKLAPDNSWEGKRWVLTEVNGVPVQLGGGNRDAHLEFDPSTKRFTGSGGCNRINGTYSLGKKDAIQFGDVAVTKMMCADIAFENLFLSTLKTADRHTESGNIMLLKKGSEIVLKLQVR